MKNQFYKPGLIVFCFFVIARICSGQEAPTDSLLAVYRNEQLLATDRIQALIASGESSYAREYPDSILHYYAVAKQLVETEGTEEEKRQIAYYQGVALYRTTRYVESLGVFRRLLEVAKGADDTVQIIKSLSYTANCHLMLSNFSTALDVCVEGLMMSEALGEPRYIENFRAAIGLVYLGQREYEKAREYLVPTLEYSRANADTANLIRGLTNVGVSYSEEANYERSVEYHLKAYELAQAHHFSRNAGTILFNIGDCYLHLGDTTQAEYYFREGMTIAEENQDHLALARGTVMLANLYRHRDATTAAFYAGRSLALARQVGDQTILEDALLISSLLHEDKGDYQAALDFRKAWSQTRDSIYNAENKRSLFENEAKYEYEKQKLLDQIVFEEQLAAQRLTARTNRLGLLILLVLLVFAFGRVLHFRKNRNEREKMALQHQLELVKARVAAQSVSVDGVRKELELDRSAIEAYLGKPLGDSSWNILCVIFENPSVSNREIAEKVFLSLEGVSSSLRRMYQSFEVSSDSSQNLKVALLTRVVKVSLKKKPISGDED